ncbi:DUF4921 family protein [Candidatus Kryptonium thompsonii]|uniref:DUF4921 family protein n=1 Tax=Candidatus Kryptonium thompsonii TaxID=1633631 RepID=UPI0020FFF806|nr:DUF4921 family protein [Candidatus Kryptonium thompsoni]
MPDGTVKQINPFTESEVWSVPGRNNKPITNEVPETAKPLEVHHPEDYCSFCQKRYYEVPPEKSRLIKLPDGSYKRIDYLPPDKYFESVAEFRRVGNLFEIVTLDYWRKQLDKDNARHNFHPNGELNDYRSVSLTFYEHF